MEILSEWLATIEQAVAASFSGVTAYLPALLAALALMLVGWAAASIARLAFIRSGDVLGSFVERLGGASRRVQTRLTGRAVVLLGNVVFWVVLLLFAAVAARVARIEAFSGWLNEVVGYLPTFIAGILIAFAGFLLSALARDIVRTALGSMGSKDNELAGLAAQAAVLLTAVVIGLDQIGIDVTFLIIIVAVVLGGALLSLAVAFGLGARDFVSNVIAAREARKALEPGNHASIAGVEGRVLEITPTSIVLINDDGRHFVPASLLQRERVSIKPDEADEQ